MWLSINYDSIFDSHLQKWRVRIKLHLYFPEQPQLGIEEFYRGDYFHLQSKIYICEYLAALLLIDFSYHMQKC